MLPFIAGAGVLMVKLLAIKAAALTGFRFVQNGFDWPTTLEDLLGDKRFMTKIGKDTAGLVPAITLLKTSSSVAEIIKATHAINRALNNLPEKTRRGLDHSVGLTKICNAAIRHGIKNCGAAMLHFRFHNESYQQALENIYLVLILLGRSGSELTESDRTAIILTLISLHTHQQSEEGSKIAHILSSWQPTQSATLTSAIGEMKNVSLVCPNSEAANWITKALGAKVPTPETTLISDLVRWFPE